MDFISYGLEYLKLLTFYTLLVLERNTLYYNILTELATWMNLADSMQSQDNINTVVSQEREKCNLLPEDRVSDIYVRR